MEFSINAFTAQLISWSLTSGVRVVIIIIVAFLAWVALRIATKRTLKLYLAEEEAGSEKSKRGTTLFNIVRSGLLFIILAVAGMQILAEAGIDMKPILAAAGIVGLAVGFGAQNLVRDVISGFFILIENQIRVGDVVEVGSSSGLVEYTGLRILTLRDFNGNVHIIPNGAIEQVKNMTRDFSRYVFDIGVAYREDPEEVMAIIRRIGEEMQKDEEFGKLITEPIEVLGLDKFDNSAVVIKARITTKPIMQWKVAREFNLRLKKAFDRADIEIPFPHQTIYFGQDKKGQAPPLRMVQQGAAQAEG